jgi:thiol-disulfide isomerase/thioredoxin
MDEEFADNSVIGSPEWKRSVDNGEIDPEVDSRLFGDEKREDGSLAVHSLSGKERNHLFLNGNSGADFADVSALSGMDSASDARCFVLFDYDRDGWQDVAIVNANQPLMELFHNDIVQLPGADGGMIAIRFVGGNTTPLRSEFASRDGYGAIVEVGLSGGAKLKREHRCGEGYAAQNSATMIVGIGDRSGVESVTVRWPSGRTASVTGIAEGTLLTAYENREEGEFTQAVYRSSRATPEVAPVERKEFPLAQRGGGGLQVYTTTATWCAACLTHLPALARLKEEDGVELFGVPVDPADDEEKLAAYVQAKRPPYEMLAAIGAGEKQAVSEFLAEELQMVNPVLPSSVITDADGKVLEVMQGIPTLSQLRKWMAEKL